MAGPGPALPDPRLPGSDNEADCGLAPFCFPSHQPLFVLIFLHRNSLAAAFRRLALKRDLPLRGRGFFPGGGAPTEAAQMQGKPRVPFSSLQALASPLPAEPASAARAARESSSDLTQGKERKTVYCPKNRLRGSRVPSRRQTRPERDHGEAAAGPQRGRPGPTRVPTRPWLRRCASSDPRGPAG